MGFLGDLFNSYSETPNPDRLSDVILHSHQFYWQLCRDRNDLSEGQTVFLACYLAMKKIGFIGKLLAPTIKIVEAATWKDDGSTGGILVASVLCGVNAGHMQKQLSTSAMIDLAKMFSTDILPTVKEEFEANGLPADCYSVYNKYVKSDEAGIRELLAQTVNR